MRVGREIVSEAPGSSASLDPASTRVKASAFPLVATWSLSTEGRWTRLTFNMRPNWVVACALNLMLPAMVYLAFRVERAVTHGSFLDALVSLVGTFVTGWIALDVHKNLRLRMQGFVDEFCKCLFTRHEGRIARPLSTHPLGSVWAEAAFLLLLFTSIVVLAGRLTGALLVMGVVAFGATLLIPQIPFSLWRSSAYVEWRAHLVVMTERWTALCFYALIPAFFLLVWNSMMFAAQSPTTTGSFTGSLRRAFQQDVWLGALRRSEPSLEDENLEMLRQAARNAVSATRPDAKEQRSKGPSREELENSVFYLLGGVAGAGLLVMVLCFYGGALLGLLTAPHEWERFVGQGGNSCAIQAPGVGAEGSQVRRFSAFLLASHFAMASSINICGAVVAAEACSYALWQESLFLPAFEVLYSWVFTLAEVLRPGQGSASLARYGLLFLGIPFLVLLFKVIGRAARRAYSIAVQAMFTHVEALRAACENVPPAVLRFLATQSRDWGVRIPRVVVIRTDTVQVYVKGHLLRKSSCLYLSTGALREMDEDALLAVVAHEFGHVTQGLRKLEWLKFLSVLAMFPNYALVLLMDLVANELRADKVAVELTGKADALIRGILIVSMGDTGSRWRKLEESSPLIQALVGHDKVRLFLRRLRAAGQFCLGDGLIGYSHPPIPDRVRLIRSYAKAQTEA